MVDKENPAISSPQCCLSRFEIWQQHKESVSFTTRRVFIILFSVPAILPVIYHIAMLQLMATRINRLVAPGISLVIADQVLLVKYVLYSCCAVADGSRYFTLRNSCYLHALPRVLELVCFSYS
jgi:hypothetical protein